MATTGPARPTADPRPLAEVAAWLGVSVAGEAGRLLVRGACLDSRAVRAGDLYAALPGARTHGGRFAVDAAAAGAVAVLTDPAGRDLATAAGLPVLVVDDPRAALGRLAARLLGEPATKLTMLGVTGTNGKTTTSFLLDAALRAGGWATGLVGTVETRVLTERVPSIRTTPEATDLQALLALMVQRGVQVCTMEVSSHAIALHRVDGVMFDVAGFTNLSEDHLDFHDTMEDYFAAKAQLFTPARARHGVICVDDEWGRRLAASATIPVTTFATAPGTAGDRVTDWTVAGRVPQTAGTAFTLRRTSDGRDVVARCPLPGDFNVANTALALLMMTVAGFDVDEAAGWLAAAEPVPGRMERVPGSGRPGEPVAIIDYAHTPDAVAVALDALRPAVTRPLVVVLGAGGDRDRQKRPRMGFAAASRADVVVVTDDNPRSEDPAAIRAAVLEGARAAAGDSGAEVLEVPDRRAAIAEGVRRAWGGGTLLVAGKGHERGQEIAGTVHPFDDRQVVTDALSAPSVARDVPGAPVAVPARATPAPVPGPAENAE